MPFGEVSVYFLLVCSSPHVNQNWQHFTLLMEPTSSPGTFGTYWVMVFPSITWMMADRFQLTATETRPYWTVSPRSRPANFQTVGVSHLIGGDDVTENRMVAYDSAGFSKWLYQATNSPPNSNQNHLFVNVLFTRTVHQDIILMTVNQNFIYI